MGFLGRERVVYWGRLKILIFRNATKTKVGFIQFVGILGTNKRGVVGVIGNDFIGFL